MTEIEILDGLLEREAGWRDPVRRPDGTLDPPTYRGVTASTLGSWRKLGRPASRAELLDLGDDEVRAIYRALYIDGPGFTPDRVPFEALRVQLVDFGVTSGPPRAIRYLQRVIQVGVTSILDSQTEAWLHAHTGYLWLVNDALAGARARMICGAVEAGSVREADERGLLRRAAAFVVSRA